MAKRTLKANPAADGEGRAGSARLRAAWAAAGHAWRALAGFVGRMLDGPGLDVRPASFAVLVAALLAVAGLAAVGEALRAVESLRAGDAARPSVADFTAGALGSLPGTTTVTQHPDGTGAQTQLPAGQPLEIGGRVRLGQLPWSPLVLWVRWSDGAADAYGFVPASLVSVAAGVPASLSLAALGYDTHGRPLVDAALAGSTFGSRAVDRSAASAGGEPEIVIPWLPATIDPWRPQLLAASARYGVDAELLAIVVLVESGGNPSARSPSGAMGLMQVMPFHFAAGQDAFDVATNIDVGARYLAQQLMTFGTAEDPDWQLSVELAAAAYNGGPGSVRRLLGGGSLPSESASYRRWVGGMWRERHLPSSPTYERWLAAGGRQLVAAAARRATSRRS